MPTLLGEGSGHGSGHGSAGENADALVVADDNALLATAHGGVPPLAERFRRARLRQQMFGDAGEELHVGRYRIVGKIGEGAMGVVYRAVDTALEREVALKVLHRRDATHRARMQIEAKALAKLSHPNVVTVHEVDTADDQLYVAMEYVPGKTLDRWLEDATPHDVLDIFVQAARGLHAAHEAGVVHRDFKPENIIVGDDGRVRVLDFGLARSPGAVLTDEVEPTDQDADVREPAITRTGMLAGTPSYMAPEQFMGSRVDARADQFAFCIVLHEAIWGTRPFAGDNLSELAKSVGEGQSTLFASPPRISLAPHQMDAAKRVVERGLRTEPGRRLPSMQDVVDRLRPLPAVSATPPGSANRFVFVALTSVALLGLLGLAAAFLFLWSAPDSAAASEHASQLEAAAIPPVPPVPPVPPSTHPEQRRCGLGTYEKDGTCHPVVLDPSGLRCEAGEDCLLARKLLVGDDGNAPLIATQGRLVPAIVDGKSTGLKLYGIRKHSIPERLGFEPGDLVQKVNGLQVVGERQAIIDMLTRDLSQTPRLDIDFVRDGEPKRIAILLVE